MDKDLKKKNILVIDDDLTFSTIIRDELIKENLNIKIANNGKIGLKIALQDNPDLVILDLIMPEMDGIEVLREIRADERGKKMAVLLLTQLGDSDKVAKAVEMGVSGYLVKADYSIPEILNKIKSLLK